MKFTVHVNKNLDIYYISSGCGNLFHNNHPQINENEVINASVIATDETLVLRDHMRSGNAPTAVMRQVIANQSGLNYQRGFFRS